MVWPVFHHPRGLTCPNFLQYTDKFLVALPMNLSKIDVFEVAFLFLLARRFNLLQPTHKVTYSPGFAPECPFIDLVENILLTTPIFALILSWSPRIICYKLPPTTNTVPEGFHR